MRKRSRIAKYMIVAMLFLVALVLMMSLSRSDVSMPMAKNGVLDLRGWDFFGKGNVYLNGKWEFYYGKLLTPVNFAGEQSNVISGKAVTKDSLTGYISIPGNFNGYIVGRKPVDGFGYATYHLKVLVDDPGQIYAVKTMFIQTAHKLWANGRIVSEAGRVGTQRDEMEGGIVPRTGFFHSESGEIDMVLQVSNFFSRTATVDEIAFGTDTQIDRLTARGIGLDMFIFGCAMIGGIYHLVIFLIRRKDKTPLFFALVCFVVGLRTVLVGERLFNDLFNINHTVNMKLLMWTFYLYVPMLVLFVDGMYPHILSKNIVKISNHIGMIYFVIILILPEKYYNHIALPSELCAAALLLYILVKMFTRYLKGNVTYLLPGISVFILFVARFNDILYEYSIIQTGSYAPFGVLIFIIMQSYILADKFSRAFGDIEVMSEKLKEMDSLKDDFLSNTSQELKTPLNGIVGLLDSLTSGIYGRLNKDQNETVKIVKATSKRLINLVNDIMDFSRLKNNDVTLDIKPVNLRQQAQITIKNLENSLGIKNVIIINNIKNGLCYVMADESRIQQVLRNLLENAVKFTSFGTIVIAAEEKGGLVIVSVADTGIGIPATRLDHIFERYDNADNIDERGGGAGLGLYITRKLVNLMGGEIHAESVVDKGSRFTFTMQKCTAEKLIDADKQAMLYDMEDGLREISMLHKQSKSTVSTIRKNNLDQMQFVSTKAEQVQQLSTSTSDTGVEKIQTVTISTDDQEINILLVDDENVNIRVISYFLRSEGYNVHTASNAKEAMDIINSGMNLDLIILDMMLPDMLGYEICSILRDTHTLFELPVLMMTADHRVESLVVSLECGANDYMYKPVERAELLARVKTLITLKQAVKKALILQKEILNSTMAMAALNENVEENIRQLSEMKEYDKLKTEFFANISHELRTPLNVIWGTLQLLDSMNKAGTVDETSISKHLKVMNQNTLRLVRLINNIIDTTKIDGGYLSLQLVNKDIVFIVEEITLSSAEYIESKGKALIFDTDVEEKIMAIDEEKLERIILNILSNAIKFTSVGDSIYVNFYDLGNKVRLSIKDTGIGMPEDKIEKIFERFVQVDKSFTRNNEGSGIGLSLVKSLIEMHGGTISVTSRLGEGSEFIVELPVRLLNETPELAQPNEPIDIQSKYVERIQIEFSDIYS